MLRCTIFALLIASIVVPARPDRVERRQDATPEVGQYITQVKTALYLISSTRAENTSASCADSSLASTLDSEGYEGEYAHQLLCETAIGIQIWPDIDQASDDLTATLAGLNSVQSSENGLARVPSCQRISVATLDQAGLDGAGIRDVVCRTSGPALSATTSTAAIPTTSLAQSSTVEVTTSPVSSPVSSPSATTSGSTSISTSDSASISIVITTVETTASAISTLSETSTTSSVFTTQVPSSIASSTKASSSASRLTDIPTTSSSPTIAQTSSPSVAFTVVLSTAASSFVTNSSSIATFVSGSAMTLTLSSVPLSTPGNTTLAPPCGTGLAVLPTLSGLPDGMPSNTTAPPSIDTTWPTLTTITGSPLSFSRTQSESANFTISMSVSSGDVTITTTDYTTNTRVVYITTTVTDQASTDVVPSSSKQRGPWQWTGPWQPYAYNTGYDWPQPTAVNVEPLLSGTRLVTGVVTYGSKVTSGFATESCADDW